MERARLLWATESRATFEQKLRGSTASWFLNKLGLGILLV